MVFYEENGDEDIGVGERFVLELGFNSDEEISIKDIEGVDISEEIGDSEVMRQFVYGELATELLYDTNGDQNSVEIIYHGGESYGEPSRPYLRHDPARRAPEPAGDAHAHRGHAADCREAGPGGLLVRGDVGRRHV